MKWVVWIECGLSGLCGLSGFDRLIVAVLDEVRLRGYERLIYMARQKVGPNITVQTA